MYKPLSLQPHHGTVLAVTPFFVFTFIAQFMDSYAINTALPQIQQQLAITQAEAQWILTIFFLANAASAIPLSRVGDKYGYVIVMIIVLLLTCIFEIAQAFSPNFIALVIFRFFTGFFISGMISNRNAMNRLLPPQEKVLKFLQSYLFIANIVQLLSPFITGAIISAFGWEVCILISGACYFISIILLFFYSNPKDLKRNQKFDIFGAIVLITALSSFCLFFTFIGQQAWIGVGVTTFLTIVSVIGFYFIEKRVSLPIFPLYLTKNPVFAIIISQVIIYIVLSGQSYIMPYYIFSRQYSPLTTSFIFTISCIFSVIATIIVPQLQKRFLNRTIIIWLHLVSFIFSILIIFLLKYFWAFAICYWMIEFPLQMSLVIIYPLTLFSVPRHLASQVSAIPTTSRTVGMSIAYCIFAMVQQLAVNSSTLESQTEREMFSYKMVFIIPGPLLVINMVLVWFRIAISESEIHKKGYNEKWLRVLQNVPLEEVTVTLQVEEITQSDYLADSNVQEIKIQHD